MALYANENGTLQQLSDKSSGSNPYVQLEVVYSRNFVDEPLILDNASTSIEHTMESNKPLSAYHNLICMHGPSPNSMTAEFSNVASNWVFIPLHPTYRYYSSDTAGKLFRKQIVTYAFIDLHLPADINSNLIKFKYASSYGSALTLNNIVLDFYLI